MKALRIALIAALVLAAIPVAMATTRDSINTPILPSSIAVGGLYDRSLLNQSPVDAPPVSLPMPTEPTEFSSLKGSEVDSGIIMFSSSKSDFGAALGGSALVSPRGGAMSSPQQLAEREIHRLIRRLH